MNGLGIVLEEPELRPQDLAVGLQPSMLGECVSYKSTEALLPPLPDENPASLTTMSPPHANTSSPTVLQKSFAVPDDAEEAISPQQSHVVMSDLFAQPRDLLLDPQALNDTPLADPFALAHAASALSLPPTSPVQTSPLKRLRNGIRKLSLSKSHTPPQLLASSLSHSASNLLSNSSAMVASAQLASTTSLGPQETPFLRPLLTPLQTDSAILDAVSSSIESLNSGLSSHTMSSSVMAPKSSSVSTTPQEQTYTSPYSSSHTPVSTKIRHRDLSASNYNPNSVILSHSLPQPIIMLSDNLSASSDLLAIEQSFLESLTYDTEKSAQPLGISNLRSSDELINYLAFLKKHKQSVDSAYEATKQCLISSGWCSSHDLENLSLQRDSALSQIDTKLLQIEEQLNSRFQLSIFKNSVVTSNLPSIGDKGPKEASLSPSLKVLESRCLSFAQTQA